MSQMNTEQGGHGEARLAEGRAEKLTPPGPLGRGTGLRLVLLTTLGGRHCHLRVALTPLKEADGRTRRPDRSKKENQRLQELKKDEYKLMISLLKYCVCIPNSDFIHIHI